MKHLLEEIYQPLQASQMEWVVAGSVATALQGCRVTPGDIDVQTREASGVFRFAELLAAYTPFDCEFAPGTEKWRSSQALPVSGPALDQAGYRWHFGRWYIKGFKVEVAHILPPLEVATSNLLSTSIVNNEENGIWENGPEIWPYVKKVDFEKKCILVIPLEIQLETNLKLGKQARVAEIIRIFREHGYDKDLVKRSLSKSRFEEFQRLITFLPPDSF